VAATLLDHDGVGGRHPVYHPQEVDLDDPAPVHEGEVRYCPRHVDAGVVEHEVERPVLPGGARHQVGDGLRVGDVQRGRHRRSAAPRLALSARRVGGGGGPVLVDVGEDAQRAVLDERGGNRLSDPRRSPGDNGGLAPVVARQRAAPARGDRHEGEDGTAHTRPHRRVTYGPVTLQAAGLGTSTSPTRPN
jgi:hypothetical protein